MLNFTVGPVMSNDEVLAIGGEQVPYFRTQEFSDIMLENERLMKKFVNASEEARAVFITGSGTASMEAVVMNVFREKINYLLSMEARSDIGSLSFATSTGSHIQP